MGLLRVLFSFCHGEPEQKHSWLLATTLVWVLSPLSYLLLRENKVHFFLELFVVLLNWHPGNTMNDTCIWRAKVSFYGEAESVSGLIGVADIFFNLLQVFVWFCFVLTTKWYALIGWWRLKSHIFSCYLVLPVNRFIIVELMIGSRSKIINTSGRNQLLCSSLLSSTNLETT